MNLEIYIVKQKKKIINKKGVGGNMKDVFVIIVILIIVFGGSFAILKYYELSGGEILAIIDEMSNDLENDNEEIKLAKINELKEKWDKTENIWIMLQHHDFINNIEDVIIECCGHYLHKNREEFEISKNKIKRNIDDLKNKEQFSLMNIM